METFDVAAITLIEQARRAATFAYSPYSGFRVGAAAEFFGAQPNVYTGCNVENVSYGLTMCAERVAIGSAVAVGAKKLKRIAVVSVNTDGSLRDRFMPCGACLQVIAEFGSADTELLIPGAGVCVLRDLLPSPFRDGLC
jgi:cytidine deaminase